MVASLAATYYNPWKFERFARQVLGDRYDAEHSQLRQDFKQSLNKFLKVAWNDTHRGLYPTEEGPGRTDAFGRIANASFGDAISPENYRVANAPGGLPTAVGYLDLRLGAMERLGPATDGTEYRRSARRGGDPDVFRRRWPTASRRCALPVQRTSARTST